MGLRDGVWTVLRVTVVATMTVNFAAKAETLELNDPGAIELAAVVSDRVDDLSDKVMACIDANGGDHKPCICLDACTCPFEAEYLAAEAAFREAIDRHPEWKDRVIHFTRPGNPMGYNLAFDGLARQFGSTCGE